MLQAYIPSLFNILLKSFLNLVNIGALLDADDCLCKHTLDFMDSIFSVFWLLIIKCISSIDWQLYLAGVAELVTSLTTCLGVLSGYDHSHFPLL